MYFGVSGVLIALPRCRVALTRDRLRTAGLFHRMPLWLFYTLPVVQARTCAAPNCGGLTAAV